MKFSKFQAFRKVATQVKPKNCDLEVLTPTYKKKCYVSDCIVTDCSEHDSNVKASPFKSICPRDDNVYEESSQRKLFKDR